MNFRRFPRSSSIRGPENRPRINSDVSISARGTTRVPRNFRSQPALHAKLAEVAGNLIVHQAQEGMLAALGGRREVAEALGVEADAE